MYALYAALFHLPNVCIKESSKPCSAAVIAAPIQKLWPLYNSWFTPALLRAVCKCRTRIGLVSGDPSFWMNRGPGEGGRTDRYLSREDTGHIAYPVDPRKMSTPSLNGSVLLCLMRRHICDGAV